MSDQYVPQYVEEWEKRGARASTPADRPDRFIEQHVSPLFFRNTTGRLGDDCKVIQSEIEFWHKGNENVLKAVRLSKFRLSDWFPRAPGVYWSDRAHTARYKTFVTTPDFDPELGTFYSPRSKMDLIEDGGIGTIRLRPRRIDGEDCWMATALTGEFCHSGVPLAIPDRVLRSADVAWGDQVMLEGRVRFLQDTGLDDTAAHVHHAPPLVVFVD